MTSDEFSCKRYIITGNGSGIGKALQESLGGSFIYGTHENGERVYDISTEHGVAQLFHGIDRIDGLVNCAGIIGGDQDYDRIWRTNYMATLWASELAVLAGARSIVNVGSMVGITGAYGRRTVYAASKAAVHNLTKTHARTLSPCRVNCVAPGFVKTGIHDDIEKHNPKGYALLQRWAEPDEIAAAIRWFLSDDSSYCTGSILEVGGGR